MTTDSGKAANRTLERAAAILDAVGAAAISASEVARRTGLSVSTAHRLGLQMVEYGFLQRTPDGSFRMGQRLMRSALEKAAAPILEEIRETTGETAQLWVRRGQERVCIVNYESKQELRATNPAGSRLQLPAGSAGRLLAATEDAIEEIDRTGWVESVGRRTPGLGSVSVAVNSADQLVGALCLAMPLARVVDSPGRDYGDLLLSAAARLEAAIAL